MEAESQRWRQSLGCPHSGQRAGGEALDGGYGLQPILWSGWTAWGLRTQTSAELPLGRGCGWFGAVTHGWWGEDPVFGRR